MANKDTSLSNQIYKSRDETRNQIIDYMRTYLELENVDLTKSTFLSFLINTLATLTSNLVFYQSSVYKEFFLTKAQLNESIYNLSSFLGYEIKLSEYSEVDVLFTIPLEFSSNDIEFTIPDGFTATAGEIEFRTDYETIIKVTNNSSVSITIIEENRSYDLPVGIDNDNNEFYFILPLKQLEVNEQEFQVDDDVRKFQFVNIDVPLNGKISSVNVFVRSPDSSYTEAYTEYSSLYLMGPDDRGFVQRKTDEGIRLYFGNGLIGYQPEPGSTVIVESLETNGADGNVIPGSITNGDRVYVVDDGDREILNYSITNPESATGGRDEEGVEEIRSNAIQGLKSMDRLVSDDDYDNFHTIIDEPIIRNSVPVLKRSDLKVNEIQLYTTIYEGDVLVPTRNEIITTEDEYIPRNYIIESDGEEFITIFDMFIDPINKVALYYYYINIVEDIPVLDRTYTDDQMLIVNSYKISREDNNCVVEVNYTPINGTDCSDCEAKLQIIETQDLYDMTNNYVDNKFTLSISFDDLPNGNLSLLFDIYHIDDLLSTYSTSITFKNNLENIMMSNVVIDSTNSEDFYIVYDVPTIKKSYFEDDPDEQYEQFERLIMQGLVNLNLQEKRMLTDFLNLKMANTSGYITNMLKNETKTRDVIDTVDELPTSDLTVNDRYILSTDCNIYTYLGDGDWRSSDPSTNLITYVKELGYKLIYTGRRWIKPVYSLPLNILIEIFIESNIVGTESGLIEEIKDVLYDNFSDRFGPGMPLYRSEIINLVHDIDGVKYCNLRTPESDIFFNYNVDNFDQDELLEYTPELVYFDRDTITVRVFRG